MAVNGASHNPLGEETGPSTGPPPPVSDESKKALLDAAESDPVGQNAPGQDSVVKKSEAKVEKMAEQKGQGAGKDAGV